MGPKKKGTGGYKMGTMAFLILFSLAAFFLFFFHRDKILFLLECAQKIGVWGNVVIIILFIIISFPFMFGYIPLTVAAGYLYGMVWGTITISVGASLGCSITFWVCRKMGRDWVESKLMSNPKFNFFMNGVESNAWKISLLSRLLPFPFGLVNALFALSSIRFSIYFGSSVIGLLPFQIMWTYFGTTLRSLADAVSGEVPFGPMQQFLLVVQITLGLGLALYLFQLARNAVIPEDSLPTASGTKENTDLESGNYLLEQENLFSRDIARHKRQMVSSNSVTIDLSGLDSPQNERTAWSPPLYKNIARQQLFV